MVAVGTGKFPGKEPQDTTEQAQTKLMALETMATPATRAPSPPIEMAAPAPAPQELNLALDPPPSLGSIASLTPKQAWDNHLSNYLSTPLEKMRNWTVRRPHFTLAASTPTIPEETSAARSGGAGKDTPVELVCRAVVAERRGMKEKLKQRSLSKWLPIRLIANIMLFSAGCTETVLELIYKHCYENMTLHHLLTLSMLIHATADKLWVPALKYSVKHVTSFIMQISATQTKAMIEHLRTALAGLVSASMAKMITLAAVRLGLAVTEVPNAVPTRDAVQAASTPSATPVSMSTDSGETPNLAGAVPADDDGGGTLMAHKHVARDCSGRFG